MRRPCAVATTCDLRRSDCARRCGWLTVRARAHALVSLAVYKKLKEGTQHVSWKAEEEEEFEDADGNVLSRKMYDDMVREGIIQA